MITTVRRREREEGDDVGMTNTSNYVQGTVLSIYIYVYKLIIFTTTPRGSIMPPSFYFILYYFINEETKIEIKVEMLSDLVMITQQKVAEVASDSGRWSLLYRYN